MANMDDLTPEGAEFLRHGPTGNYPVVEQQFGESEQRDFLDVSRVKVEISHENGHHGVGHFFGLAGLLGRRRRRRVGDGGVARGG